MPKLPNRHKATIDRRKITHYLLSREHPTGRAKAAFFEDFGFRREYPEVFERRLIEHAYANAVAEVIKTRFGTKFIISGRIDTPLGVSPKICVVWFCGKDEQAPHLVTAFPD